MPKVRPTKWYKCDDEKTHYSRKRVAKQNPVKLRKNVVPGQVLIILSGRFRGKRVVFLRQLPSGMLLVTGPFKINGVPLKRVNQAYVIPTSAKVNLAGVNFDKVQDAQFKKPKEKRFGTKSEGQFFAAGQKTEEQKQQNEAQKKQNAALQSEVDKPLIANIKKEPFMRKYLKSRFTINNSIKPHELVF